MTNETKKNALNHSELSSPRLSATVAVARRLSPDAHSYEVLTVKRSESTRVLPGFTAFPGGTLEPVDVAVAKGWARRQLEEVWDAIPPMPKTFSHHHMNVTDSNLSPQLLYLALIGAGLRELFEETGILALVSGFPLDEELLRSSLLSGTSSDWSKLAGGVCGISPVRHLGRRVTPKQFRHRFDTHFFAVEVPRSMEYALAKAELQGAAWTTPREVLQEAAMGRCDLAPPTIDVLRTLDQFPALDALLAEGVMPGPIYDEARGRELEELLQRRAKP